MEKKWFYITSYGRHAPDEKFSHTVSEVFYGTEDDLLIKAKQFKSPGDRRVLNIFELKNSGEKVQRGELSNRVAASF